MTMIKFFCAAISLFVLCSSAFGQSGIFLLEDQQQPSAGLPHKLPPIPRWNDPRVVFITNTTERGGGVGCTCGSIITIAGRPHVLTVSHDTNGPRAVVNIHFQDGRVGHGTNIAYDRTADCSIFRLDSQCQTCFAVAAGSPPLPCQSRMRGFPESRTYRDRVGTLGPRYTTAWSAQGAAIEGESGGPVTDMNDQIIGIISATDGRTETIVVPWPAVRRLADEVALSYGGPADRTVATTACPGGQCYGGQCYGGNCGPGAYSANPYTGPIYQQQPQRPQPYGHWESQPPQPQQPAPPPLQPTTPVMPTAQPCPCGPKWQALEAELKQLSATLDAQLRFNTEITATVKAQNQALTDIKTNVATTINQKFETYQQAHPVQAVPTIDEILVELDKHRKPSTLNFLGDNGKIVATATITPGEKSDVTLPPSFIRVQDSRGAGFSTEYQPFRSSGSYITLPFGPAKQ